MQRWQLLKHQVLHNFKKMLQHSHIFKMRRSCLLPLQFFKKATMPFELSK